MKTYDASMAPRFRAALLEQASQLDTRLAAEVRLAAADDAQEVADQKDVAARDVESRLFDIQASQASTRLDEICAALSRIRDGSYGICIDCGDPIDLQRLAAMPEAPRCASCQGAHEKVARNHH